MCLRRLYLAIVLHSMSHNSTYPLWSSHTVPQCFTFIVTWVEKDDGFERSVLVVIDLNVLEGLDQLVQHVKGHPGELRFQTVPLDHTAVAW